MFLLPRSYFFFTGFSLESVGWDSKRSVHHDTVLRQIIEGKHYFLKAMVALGFALLNAVKWPSTGIKPATTCVEHSFRPLRLFIQMATRECQLFYILNWYVPVVPLC